jgi:hypothetical protein
MTRVTFDNADHPTGQMTAWSRAEDVAFWGPAVDGPGDPVVMEQTPDGTVLVLGGRRVPAALAGGEWRTGLPGRVGRCAAFALVAVEQILRDHPDAAPSLCFGRAFGSQQTWAEAGGQVWDLTLSEEPWDRDEYYRALHARPGTRVEIPDVGTLAAFHEAIAEGAWWDSSWRPDSLGNEALARRQQKAG